MYPQPPPPPKKRAAGPNEYAGRKGNKNLSGQFNAADVMRRADEAPAAPAAAAAPPVEEMAKMKIHKKSMAVGGIVHGPTIRRPHNHRMIGIQSFEHGKIKAGQVGFIDDSSPKFAQATFYQGGYFAGADHQLI